MPQLKAGDKPEEEERNIPPDEEVLAVALADVEEKEMTFTNRETGEPEKVDRLKWSFIITEPGTWQGETVTGMTSTSFVPHPDCKAYKWASNLEGGKEYAADETLDTDDLIGKPARVLIAQNTKDGRTYANVATVLQARPGAVAQPTPF